MINHIMDFQIFIMGVMLLSNAQYLYFALLDIRSASKNHQNFVNKCLLFSLYIMFFSIFFVIKHIFNHILPTVGLISAITLGLACCLFLLVTLLIFKRFQKKFRFKIKVLDKVSMVGFVLLIAFNFRFLSNTLFFTIIFALYGIVTLTFLYNIVFLKKTKMNYGLYFIFVAYLVMAFVNLSTKFLPFSMVLTVNLALDTLTIYGLYLFYTQYYIEELDQSYTEVLRHVNALEKLNEKVSQMAYQDHLTNMPNELAFVNDLDARSNEPLGLLMINLRNFSSFNQILGFNQGNALLKKVAEQLFQLCSPNQKLFKLYNDKFIITMPTENAGDVFDLAYKIQDSYAENTILNFKLEIGIGMTLFNHTNDCASDLIGTLEMASTRSKQSESKVYYLPMQSYLLEKAHLNLDYHLGSAIEKKTIEVYYQPQVNALSKEVCAFEALARWQHEGKFIPPDVFIPLSESNGLITKLTHHIIESVFSTMHTLSWHQGKKVSINLSAIQLVESNFVQSVLNILHKHPISPNEVVFEITETALLYDVKKVEETISKLKTLGFEISLDDFGTGYSSLNRFSKLNFDEVKFDRFFIKDLEHDEKLKIVFSKTMDLFNTLDMRIVVEGVESKKQEEILDQYKIHHYQGYYYAKPMPLEALLSHLA